MSDQPQSVRVGVIHKGKDRTFEVDTFPVGAEHFWTVNIYEIEERSPFPEIKRVYAPFPGGPTAGGQFANRAEALGRALTSLIDTLEHESDGQAR